MTDASALLSALAADPMARLRWRVVRLLGICPASPRARLMTRRQVLEYACQLALDAGAAPAAERAAGENPNFDPARFRALGGR